MKKLLIILAIAAGSLVSLAAAAPRSVLFVGNSFTFGQGSAVRTWRSATVSDINAEGIGGVPALFKAFTEEASLDYDVSLETHPGVGLDWHLANKRDALTAKPYDIVIMHGYSTLDSEKAGDPAKLIATTKEMAAALAAKNSAVEIHLTSTWSRADQTYPQGRPWFGKPIEQMATDVRAGYDKAAAVSPSIKSVVPVGEAWNRAFAADLADRNPYDGIDAGKINLWAADNYHASTFGYYLEALMVFGDVTRRDPRSLGDGECAAFEFSFLPAQTRALQQIAFDQLSANKVALNSPAGFKAPVAGKCK